MEARAKRPKNAPNAPKRMVSSNVMGMNDGAECRGRPPMFSGKLTASQYHWRR